MWLVKIALTKPYTFIVLAILIFLLGVMTIARTPKDIFPNIDIPVVSVVWNYTGLLPHEMAGRITSNFERALATTVNDIEHTESQSLIGVSVTKVFFHEHTNISIALSQVTAIAQTILRVLPPGSQPPLILSYNASSVPIIQLVLSSKTLSEEKIFDLGNNFIRTQLAVVEGASLPYPYGGKVRQIMVDLNLKSMQTYGVTPQQINTVINQQNLIIPAGTEKVGQYEYFVRLNASPLDIKEFNDFPIKTFNHSVIYMRDVAHVHDGNAPQTNIVSIDGIRAVLMTIQKTGNASTLDIINQVKAIIPQIKDQLPSALKISTFGDQSIFVKAAIKSVIIEGVTAAILTGLMILLFVGSWRSALIITISIPLSILSSLIILSALGETINIMTLGGLALAVGILVDDATVAIENINWHLEQKKPIDTAILDGAHQIAVPALVSTLCICIVFIPIFFLSGVAHYLFVPLAEAVVFAMMVSYFLSRTLVATLAKYWLTNPEEAFVPSPDNNLFEKIIISFNRKFQQFRTHYETLLDMALDHSKLFIIGFLIFLVVSFILLTPGLGSDFFPTVDAGQIKLHIRAPTGTRVEETAKISDDINRFIREIIPKNEIENVVYNVGLPISATNLSYSNSSPVGPGDADILVSLTPHHHSTFTYMKTLRKQLPQKFPGISFAFLPADMVGQILNFGLPAPINIQVAGLNIDANKAFAAKLLNRVKQIPGIVDALIQQSYNYPQLNVDVDRTIAKELDITQQDTATNLLLTLSGSQQTAPAFWLDPKNGVSYPVVTQAPQYRMTSLDSLRNIPVSNLNNPGQILGAMSTIHRTGAAVVESHYNVIPVIDIYATIQDRDLGSIGSEIKKLVNEMKKQAPKGSHVSVRGQLETQASSFHGLFSGLFFAILLVYFLIVINFQSWKDPFIIITALPAGIIGIIWMLFLTHTTLSVPALMGAIMTVGVATANSILFVSFAREKMSEGLDARAAVKAAGFTRIRPIMMTASAMIIGMIPMALAIGEGAEQNAPLGRAVIGGLFFATFATLFFVPAVFNIFHGKKMHTKEI